MGFHILHNKEPHFLAIISINKQFLQLVQGKIVMYNNSRACCFGSSLQRKVCAIRARGGIPPTTIYNIIKERLYMKAFMDKDFLLETPTAQHLYHDYSAKLPIVDYHCTFLRRKFMRTAALRTSRRSGWAAIRCWPTAATTISATTTSGA